LNGKNKAAGLSWPEQKNYDIAYSLALKLAGEKLARRDDIYEQCRRSGTVCDISDTVSMIRLKYFDRDYVVTLPDITVTPSGREEQVELRDKILMLDYLERAKGTPLTGRLIGYQELAEGAVYYPSFFARAVKPLIENFGSEPGRLIIAAKAFGGVKADYGDTAVTIPAFSRVPITLIVWKGDEEFSPNASVLFDTTVLDYLSPEDVNVLCQTLTWRLIKLSKNDSNS
jgi:hypothetical protein